MKIGIPYEIHELEKCVAARPSSVRKLIKLGHEVMVEREAGATVVKTPVELYKSAECILKVRAPEVHTEYGIDELMWLRKDSYPVSYLWPAQNPDLLEHLAS